MRQSTYLCVSWQGFIQYIVTMVGKGYYFYLWIKPRESMVITEERQLKIDGRLMEKFQIVGMSKHNRYYNRKRGMANFLYLRYNSLAMILKSPGEDGGLSASEEFMDIRETPTEVEISTNIQFKINLSRTGKSWTAYFTKECYRSIKAEMLECLEHRQIRDLEYKFKALNNLPAYTGINEQKMQLRKVILQHAKKNRVVLNKDNFWICFKRKIYKVFSGETENNEIESKDNKP